MARLVGILGNRSDWIGRVLHKIANELRVRPQQAFAADATATAGAQQDTLPPTSGALGWGFGFHFAGEVLMRRKPVDDDSALDFSVLARDIRADAFVAHVRSATVGSLRPENTHPFRYRQWLFAQTGTVSAYQEIAAELEAALPPFVRGTIKGDTDAERVFCMFIAALNERGALEHASTNDVHASLRATIDWLDARATAHGVAPSRLNLLVSSGDFMAMVVRGAPAYALRIHGREGAEWLLGAKGIEGLDPSEPLADFVVLASDFRAVPPAPWKRIVSSLVSVERGKEIDYLSI